MKYNWQHPDWPHFTYQAIKIMDCVERYLIEFGETLGVSKSLDTEKSDHFLIDIMVEEALKTSQIEGENLNPNDLRSSLQYNMGLGKKETHEPRAKGMSLLMIDVRSSFKDPITVETLWKWHDLVIQDPHDRKRLPIGQWRTDETPMQIISGTYGHEVVHYEAPPSHRVAVEMERFIQWFNETNPMLTGKTHEVGIIRAALAHLYFESIHPFADGNGRIGRAIAEKALSQDLGQPLLLSLSHTLYERRKLYYSALSAASSYTMDSTEWISFFVNCVLDAQIKTKETILFIIKKNNFWITHKNELNDRQEKVLHRMLDEGLSGFKGGINARKYMILTECSKATATRDLTDLLEKKCLIKLDLQGRNTSYEVNMS